MGRLHASIFSSFGFGFGAGPLSATGRHRRSHAGNLLVQCITPGKAPIDWVPIGELLGDALGQMKGPVLKLGQQASQWQDLLPAPISVALARL